MNTERLERLAYRPRELPDLLGLSRGKVYALLRSGDLPCVRLGGRLLIPREALNRYLMEAVVEAQHANCGAE